ncbi:response regulator [Alteromonas halophila]|uniref:Response regulator n=1 Tax=Alteromonas halophila TaxID=516698 RepID=A0A918JLN1_9ALTE|nr:response regulator [Alteromonas halophila]GGW88329.1 response regulator [Alteromonas halophila]
MTFSDKHVLIIEDQRPFLLLLRGLLNSMGATDVITKPSAEQAISLCRKQKFDIIVCDLHLGAEKKNGFELIEELRVRKLIKPSTICLLISADSARPVVLGSIERRPDDYLIKPFSQAQLKTRISRAWQKRQFLQPVYKAIMDEEWDQAIDTCEQLAGVKSPYQRSCEQLLVELYWEDKQPDKALDVLAPYQSGKPLLWAQIALAKTHLLKQNYEQAIATSQQVLEQNRFNADAYDVLAQSNNAMNCGDAAIAAIRQAIKLSPFSLPRHFVACSIARDNNDYVLASASSESIWKLSKHTVHQTPTHWCGYVRSLLDVAEFSDDKHTRNRYQQEALLVTQRGKFDEYLNRQGDDFDVDIFENIVNARVNAIDGKMLDAKRNLASSQVSIEEKFEHVPTAYIPDSVKVMYDIGEFDEAERLQGLIQDNDEDLDPNSRYLLDREKKKASDNLSSYQQFNREGIDLYQKGQYQSAKDAFTRAQSFAPVNTGVALNLLQCLIKLLDKNDKAEPLLIKECKRVYKLIEDMPLKQQHQEKYDALKEELFSYIGDS